MSVGRILIADDGKVMRTVISRKLEEHGYSVTAAADGQEVMKIMEGESFDMVILDIYMPVMNGTEALRRLRQIYTPIQLPVIMATAKDDDDEVVHAFEQGASDFISKPIHFPILLARIETHLKLKRAIQALERLSGEH